MSLLFCCVLLLGGCVRSTQPILKDDQVIRNDSIAGKWTNDDHELIEVQVPSEGTTYAVTHTDGQEKSGKFKLRLGKIGDLLIAEIAPAEPEGNDAYKAHLMPLYSFMVIDQTSPTLVMRTMDPKWATDYLDQNPGELQLAEAEDEKIVTSPTEDLQKFLLKHAHNKKAWTEPVTFVRPAATKPLK